MFSAANPSPRMVFMFSGQGSHYYHMGEGLFREHAVFRETMLSLDQIAESLIGESILAVLYDSRFQKTDEFERTLYTHPAIFMVEVALAKTLMSEGIQPDAVLGTSMGSFAAAVIAGCLSQQEGMAAVIHQAQCVEQHCVPGKMMAVLDSPTRYHQEAEFYINSNLAAVNFHQHFVVSANHEGIQAVQSFLGRQVNSQVLAVSQAFHSAWIDSAEQSYMEFLQTQRTKAATMPLICCANAKVMTDLPEDYFWHVIRAPIYFQKTIQHLEKEGVPLHYMDLGPSGTLATLVKYNLAPGSQSSSAMIMTPYGQEQDKLTEVLASI